MANVAFKGITKRFGTLVAVNDLNLDVADREFLVLLGPSGCGKTTTMRMVAGLETETEGEIYIGDRLVKGCCRSIATWRWCFSPTRSIPT